MAVKWNVHVRREGREGGVRVRENGRVELKSREDREAEMQRGKGEKLNGRRTRVRASEPQKANRKRDSSSATLIGPNTIN